VSADVCSERYSLVSWHDTCCSSCCRGASAAGNDQETAGRNRIRKGVTDLFRERRCVTLVRPVEEESLLQELDRQPPDVFRPEFRDQVSRLRNMLFDNARVKTVNGLAMNGPMLIELANTYVDVRQVSVAVIVLPRQCRCSTDASSHVTVVPSSACFPTGHQQGRCSCRHRRVGGIRWRAVQGVRRRPCLALPTCQSHDHCCVAVVRAAHCERLHQEVQGGDGP
jgi:hypothetical protein